MLFNYAGFLVCMCVRNYLQTIRDVVLRMSQSINVMDTNIYLIIICREMVLRFIYFLEQRKFTQSEAGAFPLLIAIILKFND